MVQWFGLKYLSQTASSYSRDILTIQPVLIALHNAEDMNVTIWTSPVRHEK